MKQRAWFVYPLVGAVVTLAYLFVPALNHGPVFNAVGLSSPLVIVLAVRLHRPRQRLPWYLFAVGQTLFVGGDIITYNYERFFGRPLPYPSVGDLLYLSVYPCLIAGLLLLIRQRSPGRDRASLIDSIMIAIGVAVLSWTFLMSPYAHDRALSLLQKVVAMGYPLMDMVLLGVAVRLAVGGGRRPPAFSMIVAAVVALFGTDTIYGWMGLHNPYTPGGLLDAGWIAFYLLWGAAALHLSMRELSDPAPEHDSRLTTPRLALLAGISLIPPVIRIIQLTRGESIDEPVLITSTVVLFLLVVARMAGLVHRQEQSTLREKALRQAGAKLVTATNRESIYTSTLDAARTLVGESAAIRFLVADEDPDTFTVAAATGGPETALGTRVGIASLPDSKRERLLGHRPIQAPIWRSELGGLLAMPTEIQFVFTAPLFLKDELRALLTVGSVDGLSQSIGGALEALASQVALALESAALTEDLLQRRSEARFRSLVQNSSDVVTVIDPDTTIRYVSPSVERVLGYAPDAMAGEKLVEIVHPDDRPRILAFMAGVLAETEGHAGPAEVRLRHLDGSWLFVETLGTNLLHDPNVKGLILNTRDVSERKAFEEQLTHQAFHDPVTGLANRALFKDRVAHALERQDRTDASLAVLFMDIDDFKTINDSLGHAAGDLLLTQVGDRLKRCLRAADTAARLGGDEFGVLLEEGGQDVRAADVAVRVMAALERPFHLGGDTEVFVRASIGIATWDRSKQGPGSAEEILRNADAAMYMAKETGKGRYQVFEPSMHDTALHRLELKADLQRAVEHGEFVLHYQPIIELESGRITGLEALIRWRHPTRGELQPRDFIPLAEETGLIVPIGEWGLREACRQARVLQERYPSDPPLHMAVNLSARELQRPEIVDEIASALMESGLEPSTLVIEITESVMMQDMDLSTQRLLEMKELGIQLAVDDFGTGYSSLNYIRRFPVDILKVDKSFIDGVNEGGEETALTAAIIELAAILKLRPVAEGIERADQLERLLDLNCDLGQGFYFARPLPTEGIEELLTARAELADREREVTA